MRKSSGRKFLKLYNTVKPRAKTEYDIEMGLNKLDGILGTGLMCQDRLVAGFCEHRNELSTSIKC
jgi:hypothetical protein